MVKLPMLDSKITFHPADVHSLYNMYAFIHFYPLFVNV